MAFDYLLESSRNAIQPTPRVHGPRHNVPGRILGVVREILRREPGLRLNMVEVAEASGFSRRTLYNHFPNAEALYRASQQAIVLELCDLMSEEIPRDLPPELGLYGFVREVTELYVSDSFQELLVVMLREDMGGEPLSGTYLRRIRQPLARVAETYLLYQRLRGDFLSADVQAAAEQLIGMIEGLTVTPRILKIDKLIAPIDEEAIRFVVNTFLAAHCKPRTADEISPAQAG